MSNRGSLLFFIMASSVLTLFATDMMLPSLPHMADFYNVSAQQIKSLISVYMLGQFMTVLLWGVCADRYGKKNTLIAGMLLFLFGCILSLSTHSFMLLQLARFCQGAGATVAPVAGWALIQDIYPGDESARVMAWVGSIVSIAPLFAPALGGKLDVLYGWHSSFIALFLFSLVVCLSILILPKHQEQRAAQHISWQQRIRAFAEIISHRPFVSYISLFGLLNCGEWCFLTVAPFYYESLHIAADLAGLYLTLTSIGFIFGSMLASYLLKVTNLDVTIKVALSIAAVSSLAIMATALAGHPPQLLFALLFALNLFSSAMLWGATTSRALQFFVASRGSASAIRSLLLVCYATLGSLVGKFLPHDSLLPVGGFLLLLSLTATLVYYQPGQKLSQAV